MYSHSKLPKLDENDKGWRPNQVLNGYNTSVGLYTGNLYLPSLDMDVNSKTGNLEMTSNNNYLDIVMTSTIKLNGSDAVKQGVASNMLNNKDTSSIYQMFLATYDMKTAEDAASLIGIQLKGKPQVTISEYKLYGGTSVVSEGGKDVSGRSWNITENYNELINTNNLIENISDPDNSYAVTMQVKYRLTYSDPLDLPIQFPVKEDNPSTKIGTRVIGYSNISSSVESAPYSATSKKYDDETNRYYVTSQKKAALEYNVRKTSGNIAGPYSDLGINAAEMDVDDQGVEKVKTKSKIRTQARYDTSMLKESGEYIEMTLRLSNKADYNSYLKISDYIENIKITGDLDSTLFDQSNDADGAEKTDSQGNVIIKVTREDNAYRIRVRKDKLQTIGNASDGVYYVPIEFEAYTGDSKFNSNSDGRMYSNYRMTLEMKMYGTIDADENKYLIPTKAEDFVVYTNAKIIPDVI